MRRKLQIIFMLVLAVLFMTNLMGCDSVVETDLYEINVQIEGQGRVVVDPDKDYYEELENVTFKAIPDDYFEFKAWKGSFSGSEKEVEIVIEDDIFIKAVFNPTESITGEGTEDDPYTIWDIDGLQKIGSEDYSLDAYYELGRDIDASETKNWNDGKGFYPIGGYEDQDNYIAFTGTLDGQGYEISGLYINRRDERGMGLFSAIENARVKNLSFNSVNIAGLSGVGALTGYSFGNSTIERVSVEGKTRASNTVGLLVGSSQGFILESSTRGEVEGVYLSIGGLTGANMGKIENSYSKSKVKLDRNAGSVYALGGITGVNLIDPDNPKGQIKNTYFVGEVYKLETSGGITGEFPPSQWEIGEVVNSYYDKEILEWSEGPGTPKTTEEMMQKETFEDWDFESVWTIEEGDDYPTLQKLINK